MVRLLSLVGSGGKGRGQWPRSPRGWRPLSVGRTLCPIRLSFKYSCKNCSRVYSNVRKCVERASQSPQMCQCTAGLCSYPTLACVSEKWRVLAAALVTCLYRTLFPDGEAGWKHTDSAEHSNGHTNAAGGSLRTLWGVRDTCLLYRRLRSNLVGLLLIRCQCYTWSFCHQAN